MEKETKEKGKHSGKKITQFPTQLDVQEELEDAAMDRFLRQSIIEDADRIERELNENPKLIGIGASDDLFGKIVEELKAKGIWEGDKKTKESGEDPAQGDLGENEKTGTTFRTNALQPIDEKKIGENDSTQKKEKDTLPKAKSVGAKNSSLQKLDREKSKKVILQQTDDEKKSNGNLLRVDKKTIQDHRQDSTEPVGGEISKNRNQDQRVDLEINAEEKRKKTTVYDMLSEADREALAFGYEMKKKEQERKAKRKRRNRRLKYVSAAVAALALVGGIGVSTEASRRWIFQVGDAILENFGISIKNNFVEEVKDVRFLNNEEEYAIKNIRDTMEISPVEFAYLPNGMKFENFEIDENAEAAVMIYAYKNSIFTLHIIKNRTTNVFYHQLDQKGKKIENIKTEQGKEIQLYEISTDNIISYVATFAVNDDYYYCSGMLPYEEMKNILKYLIIQDI